MKKFSIRPKTKYRTSFSWKGFTTKARHRSTCRQQRKNNAIRSGKNWWYKPWATLESIFCPFTLEPAYLWLWGEIHTKFFRCFLAGAERLFSRCTILLANSPVRTSPCHPAVRPKPIRLWYVRDLESTNHFFSDIALSRVNLNLQSRKLMWSFSKFPKGIPNCGNLHRNWNMNPMLCKPDILTVVVFWPINIRAIHFRITMQLIWIHWNKLTNQVVTAKSSALVFPTVFLV